MPDLEDRFNALMEKIEAERETGEEAEDAAWEMMQVVNGLGVTEDQAVGMLDAYYEELEERGFPEDMFWLQSADGIFRALRG